jgi:hypothetical protein
MSETTNTQQKSGWPAGKTFLMYCAGIALLSVAGYAILTDKEVDMKVDEAGAHIRVVKSGLSQQPVNEEAAKEQAPVLQAKFDEEKAQITSSSTESPFAIVDEPFNGTFEGAGSVYTLVQSGSEIILSETTQGITTAYGVGTASGSQAQVTIQTNVGTFAGELVFESDQQIKVTIQGPMPQSYYIIKKY